MKDHIRRISYYTRKCAQYSADRRPLSQKQHRYNRLMRYKAAMGRRLAADGYRWRPAIHL